MTAPALLIRQLRKHYRTFTLGPLDLALSPGRTCGLVGPNGAGKSTLLRMLVGLVRPDGGSIEVLGQRIPAGLTEAKRGTAFVSEDMRLHAGRSLRWHADLVRAFHPRWDESRLRALADRLELRFGQRGGELSRGQAMKALLLLALAPRPRLLVLDEPTAGLDPIARGEFLDALTEIATADGLTILFSSHLTSDIERLAHEVAFLHDGRLLHHGPCEDAVLAGAGRGDALAALFRDLVAKEVRRAG